jgi:hypothetical protein
MMKLEAVCALVHTGYEGEPWNPHDPYGRDADETYYYVHVAEHEQLVDWLKWALSEYDAKLTRTQQALVRNLIVGAMIRQCDYDRWTKADKAAAPPAKDAAVPAA